MGLLSFIWAAVCLVLNIVIPGTGTILMSILSDENVSKTHFLVGLNQFLATLTSWILLGFAGTIKLAGPIFVMWCWSIYWGILIMMKAWNANEDDKNRLLGANQVRSDQ